MSATNAVSERSVSNLRRIKDWLHTSMAQKRPNHCMILSVSKERIDNLDLVVIANDFCSGKEERWNTFDNFQQKVFPVLKDVNGRYILVTNISLYRKTGIRTGNTRYYSVLI